MRASAILTCFAAALSLAVTAPATSAPPEPTAGTAVVDGLCEDWDLSGDSFAVMRRLWSTAKSLECRAYLRYDCDRQTLFVLVLAESGVAGRADSPSAGVSSWVAIGSAAAHAVDSRCGNDGVPPDFAWVEPGFDGDPSHVRGFEASVPLGPTNTTIFIHQNPFDAVPSGEQHVSSQSGTQMVISCTTGTESSTWSQLKMLYR